LRRLTKQFDPAEVERRLIETVPIQAPEFALFLNGRRLSARPLVGHHLPFLEGTPFGTVHGEIVVLPASQAGQAEAGISCRVKQVLVKRDFFGMESWGPHAARLAGEVNADFLPLTSDRSDFIRDGPEYQAFQAVMEQVVARVRQVVDRLSDFKESRRTKRVLSDVLERVREALLRNPSYCPEGLIPLAAEAALQGPAGLLPETRHSHPLEQQTQPGRARRAKAIVSPNDEEIAAVIRRLKLGQQGLSCCVDHLGPEAPECYTEGSVVYINRDHPLHRRFAQTKEAYALYLARLLTQEIAMMKSPRSPRQAFERAGALLAFTDALG
jgi:hypothetical protein